MLMYTMPPALALGAKAVTYRWESLWRLTSDNNQGKMEGAATLEEEDVLKLYTRA